MQEDSWGMVLLYLALMAPFAIGAGLGLFWVLWKWANWVVLGKKGSKARKNRRF